MKDARETDRELVLKAVSLDGAALESACDELRGDREVVLKAVSQNGEALWWASEELKGDQEVQERKRHMNINLAKTFHNRTFHDKMLELLHQKVWEKQP